MPLSGLSSPPFVLPVAQISFMWHIVDIILPARAVGKGSLPFHAQGLCSSYSSLTHFYRCPINGQEQLLLFVFWRGLGGSIHPILSLSRHGICPVLRALKSPPFEPLQSVDLRPLMSKTALLLALASVKHMEICRHYQSAPLTSNSGLTILRSSWNHGYIPKVLSTLFRAQVITLLAFPPSEQDQGWNLLSPVSALRIYIERSALFRQSELLFVCFCGHTKGFPVTKKRLSRCIIDAIMVAYSSLG